MSSLIVTPKDNEELQFISTLLKKLHIEAKLLSDNKPNSVTLKAMNDAENGDNVTRHPGSSDLFNKLGI